MDTTQEFWQQLPVQRNMAGEAANTGVMDVAQVLYPDTDSTDAETDTTSGIPGDAEALGADADDASAAADTDQNESDTDDGTPEEEETDEAGFEKRYKDLQAEFTVKAQELAQLKTETGEREAEITRSAYALQDLFAEQEQVAEFLLNQYQGDLHQLRQVNVQQLTQQQYTQWQQAQANAAQRAQQTHQALEAVKARSREVKEGAIKRQAAISRASLLRIIDNFDESYPEIHRHAVSQGVSPDVFREITDPGLIKIIHEHRQMKSQPDVIKKMTTKTQQVGSRPSQIAKSRTPAAQPKTLEQKMYPSMNR